MTVTCNGICYEADDDKPQGPNTDGLLDVILIKPVPIIKSRFFKKFIKGEHLSLPYISTYQCREVHILSKESLAVNVDGEYAMDTPVSFGMLPLSMTVIGNN